MRINHSSLCIHPPSHSYTSIIIIINVTQNRTYPRDKSFYHYISFHFILLITLHSCVYCKLLCPVCYATLVALSSSLYYPVNLYFIVIFLYKIFVCGDLSVCLLNCYLQELSSTSLSDCFYIKSVF